MVQIILRVCPKCLTEKEISDFTYYKGRGEHYFNCKSCEAIVRRSMAKGLTNDPRRTLWERSLLNAKSIGVAHTITLNDIVPSVCCPYFGMPLIYREHEIKVKRYADNIASLDRINSSLGYVPGNVQVISFLANRMKQNANVEQLLAFAYGVIKVHGLT